MKVFHSPLPPPHNPQRTMSIDHYTVPIPASAYICPDWTSLIEEVHTKWSHSMLDKKYGGYVIEDKGAIVLVCTDELCTILEEKDRQAQTVTFHDPASDAVSLANYTVDIPLSARICSDWPSLEAAVVQRPGCRIVEKYGGFVIEEDGVVVFACDEKMSEEVGRSEDLVGLLYDDVEENAPSRS
jgi:hypothetical protein